MENHDWLWNEFQQIGTDYASIEEVEIYDKRMRMRNRDVDKENEAIIASLALRTDSTVMEIGCGTGAFSRQAARHYDKIFALDISPMMLAYAEKRADEEGLTNISFVNAGFLSFDFPDSSIDAVVSGLALHHLPDAWKAVALEHISKVLKKHGRFSLYDVLFDWSAYDSAEAYFSAIVNEEKELTPHLARHIKQEYSTMNWIMSGLLERAGFRIDNVAQEKEYLRRYLCTKM